MPNRCGVVRCNGNYDAENKCRMYKLPRQEDDQQKWMNALPPWEGFVIKPKTLYICERHWPPGTPMKTTPGGFTRPEVPPSIFPNVPPSCLPTPKPSPRQQKDPNQHLYHFLKKDKITSFVDFTPEKQLKQEFNNVFVSRSEDKFSCVFMSEDCRESIGTIIVHNRPTLCSPLTVEAYSNGLRVTSLSQILNPNNGMSTYSQFFEVVNRVKNFVPNIEIVLFKVCGILESALESASEFTDEKRKKLNFLIRQLQLLSSKQYNTADFCFAVEHFPRCTYEHLREYLVLPSKRKLQSIISSTNISKVLDKTFQKIKCEEQKQCLLIVDEVKIRPTVAYSGGLRVVWL